MTIVEFLRARMAEWRTDMQDARGTSEHQNWALRMSGDFNEGWIVAEATESLAIIDAFGHMIDEIGHYEAGIDAEYGDACDAKDIIENRCKCTPVDEITAFRFMARPWRDHPDYSREWASV